MADMDKVIARLEREVLSGNLTQDEAIAEARRLSSPPDIGPGGGQRADFLRTAGSENFGRGGTAADARANMVEALSLSPEQMDARFTPEERAAQGEAPLETAAEVTFSDGREATITGTPDEIRAAVAEIEQNIETTSTSVREQKAKNLEMEANARADRQATALETNPVLGSAKAGLEELGGRGLANLEAMGTFATGAVAAPIAGLLGLVTSPLEAAGFVDQNTAADVVRGVTETLTYEPRSVRGKEALADVSIPFEAFEALADTAGTVMGRGNPYAATAIKTAIMAVPIAAGSRPVRARATNIVRSRQLKKAQARADELGLDIEPQNLRASIIEKAEATQTGRARGEALPPVQDAVREAARVSKENVDALYTKARETKAFVETRATRDAARGTRNELIERGFDLEEMPLAQRRLAEIENLDTQRPGLPQPSRKTPVLTARLQEIETIRKRINQNRSKNPAENRALDKVKKDLDEFLDNEFNRDAISGDPAAYARWKDARKANELHAKNFKEDTFLRQMIEENATPEQLRAWMMGASSMNSKPLVARTVRRLKEVIGENHPTMEALRQEFLFDIATPLYAETPNFAAFIRNYDTFIRKNPSVVKELGLDLSDLRGLRDFAAAAEKLPSQAALDKAFMTRADAVTALTRYTFGHKIARAAVRVNFFKSIVNAITGVGKPTAKGVLYEVAGVDPAAPALSRSGANAGAIITAEALGTDE